MITIAPHDTSTPGDQVPFPVTIVYSKQVSGSGSANAFVFCESTDGGRDIRWIAAASAAAYIRTRAGHARLAVQLHQRSPAPRTLRVRFSPFPADPSTQEQSVEVSLEATPWQTCVVAAPAWSVLSGAPASAGLPNRLKPVLH